MWINSEEQTSFENAFQFWTWRWPQKWRLIIFSKWYDYADAVIFIFIKQQINYIRN